MSINAYSIALSGLNANATRVGVAANNIANMLTTGPADNPSAAYQPQEVVQTSLDGGGVATSVQNTDPATIPAFSPTDANANGDGLVALPNVNLDEQMVNQMVAVTGYKANAEVIKTLAAMDKALLDIKA